ncbi:MAG: tRNA (adenosine(37)-N6)-threonylcarbamoyltransferase complex dimerization subunit type 1 TsaB [Defluviitaleaceae bacterium]|nr:tRNA (adenosine(37)-N6)-threonylcarbamoyltransferase complex dimerization subunit type 1 TsaB [Defluviitaleaceae bacterium]
MLKILALDTSGEQGSAAIIGTNDINASYIRDYDVPNIIIGEIFFNARTGDKSWTHSEVLMPAVEQLFELTRLEVKDINYVAYTCGPGSFTGLRIGASCALGIARALGVPAIAVPTLDALAYNAYGMGARAVIIPMLDARRGQVYTAFYFRDSEGIIEKAAKTFPFMEELNEELNKELNETEYMALPIEEILQILHGFPENTTTLFLGDGACANKEIIREKIPTALFAPANNNRQRAASAGLCAIEKIRAGEDFSEKIELIYVRPPQAVREATIKAEKK